MALTHVSRLAFGRAIPTGGTVTEDDWRAFEAQNVARRFPDGFTVIHASGGWRDAASGDPVTEGSTIVEVAHDNGPETLRALRALAASYKLIFNQDAVMLTTVPASVEFI